MARISKKGRSAIHRPEYRELLDRVRAAREAAGLTQTEVARKFGRPQSFIAKIESGERRMDPVDLWELASIYDKPLSYFFPKTRRN